MANKSKRFSETTSDTPGPGAYTLSKKGDWIREVGRQGVSSAPSNMESDKTSKTGMVSLITFSQKLLGYDYFFILRIH